MGVFFTIMYIKSYYYVYYYRIGIFNILGETLKGSRYDYTGQGISWVRKRVYYSSQELEKTRWPEKDQECARREQQRWS